MKTFVTIFPDAKDIHLVKDVGQIPYLMHKLFGYDATLVAYKSSAEYSHLQETARGLKLSFISKGIHLRWFDTSVVFYLIRHSKKIDVLNLYHDTLATKLYTWIFKSINKKGFAYIKLDGNANNMKQQNARKSHHGLIRSWLLRAVQKRFSKCVDCISIETHEGAKMCLEQYPEFKEKLVVMPNGIDDAYALSLFTPKSFEHKENIILTVGRLGTPQKNTELLITAIGLIDSLRDWKVCLVGSRTHEFDLWLADFLVHHPRLSESIILVGEVNSRAELYRWYDRAKIFVLSSRYEGFPLVFPEAIFFGNVIISTNVSGASDITNCERIGKITPTNDAPALAKELEYSMSDDNYLQATSRAAADYAREYFVWPNILVKLHNFISRSHA